MEYGMKGSIVAILIGVWATFALDVYSTLNSSPWTAERFASENGGKDSLMHWVKIGGAVGVGGGLLASIVSWKIWPVIATVGVTVMMYTFYVHAVNRGLSRAAGESAGAALGEMAVGAV